jgi:competence protein ComEC
MAPPSTADPAAAGSWRRSSSSLRSASSPARLDARLVPAALTSWVVTAAGITWSVGTVAGWACLTASAAGALLWRYACERTRLRAVGIGLVATGLIGAGFGFAIALRVNAVAHHPITAAFGSTVEIAVTPVESPRSIGHGRLLFGANLRRLGRDETSGRAVVFAPERDFAAVMVGQPMRFRARMTAPTRHDLTVAVVTAIGAPTMGRAGPLNRAASAVRAGFADAARRALPADQAAMLPALVLGDMSTVTPITTQEFRTAGLTHLTAVSGANVTIVCGAVLFSARLIGLRSAVGLAGLALVLFVIVVQPSASVLRAAVMGAIALVGVLSSRRRQAIPALAAAVLVLMVVTPQLAVDVGLALSVVATAALVVVAPTWSRRLVAAGWPKPVADAVCVACAAQLVTAPLIAGISGRVSVVSAAANLAVAALIAPITVLGSAAAALCPCWPAGAQLLIRFTGPQVWWLLRIAHWSASVPGASVPVPPGLSGVVVIGAVGLLAVLLWRWRWFRAGMALAACALLAWTLSGLQPGAGGPVGPT